MIKHSSSEIRNEDFKYLQSVIDENYIGSGRLCNKFKSILTAYSQRKYTVLADSGTAALELALHSLKQIKPTAGNVLVSSYICTGVISAILRQGLRPVLIDVAEQSMNMDLGVAQTFLDQDSLCILLTNVGGIPDDYISALALDSLILSDCAQSLGATHQGRQLTSLGDIAVTSFGPTKVITAGSGGAVFSDNEEIFNITERNSLEDLPIGDYLAHGFKVTMCQHFCDLNAGLGSSQLTRLPDILSARKTIAQGYTRLLQSQASITLPKVLPDSESNYFRYYFFSDYANEWIKYLRDDGIDARASIAHDVSLYLNCANRMSNLRCNSRRLVSLPIYPALHNSDLQRINESIQRGFDKGLK